MHFAAKARPQTALLLGAPLQFAALQQNPLAPWFGPTYTEVMLQCSNVNPKDLSMNTPFTDLQASSTQMFTGLQKLGQLNMELVQTSFAEATKTMQAMMSVKNPQEFGELVAAEFKAAPAKATAYGAQVRDIFTATSQR
jgi:phasin family protein